MRFDLGDLRGEAGEALAGLAAPHFERLVRQAIDPASALRTLHWGRNYLYLTELTLPDGPVAAVVKQFRHDGWRARWRRWARGSSAERSFRAARAVEAAGVSTPEPLFFVEGAAPRAPAHYVCRQASDGFELRYYLRARNQSEEYAGVDAARLWVALAEQVAALHAHHIWHRDWTSGNVLVAWRGDDAPRLELLDLNRARVGRPLSANERLRELSRMPIHRPDDQEALLAAYFRSAFNRSATPAELRRYRWYHDAFVAKHRWKDRLRPWRRPQVRGGGLLRKRTAHPHIPQAVAGTAARDRTVWDALSDQPHQHAGRGEKLAVRLQDLPSQAGEFGRALAAWPAIRRRLRELRAAAPSALVWPGLSIGLRPSLATEEMVALLTEAGVRRASLRLHPWAERHDAEEALAGALAERGFDLAFTLPQNRELVRDPRRWDAAVAELAERFGRHGSTFQVGQAINRSKWGVWSIGEYARLAESASRILAERGLRMAGPAVIDFEFYWTAAVLQARRAFTFDAVSSLLYVDRRGAPENRQMGYDTADKVRLLRAIADRSPRVRKGAPLWISEVNWPLREGPHSPAGKAVSVDEETQADYLVRYAVLAYATGLVGRIDWWQLVAIGYGLVDPRGDAPRRRPAFHALARLERELAGCSFAGRLVSAPSIHAYAWRGAAGGSRVVAWTTGPEASFRGTVLGPRPRYFDGLDELAPR